MLDLGLSFAQDANSMTAEVSEGGTAKTITAKYLVGCDGGTSIVRKQLGFKLSGESNILQLRQALLGMRREANLGNRRDFRYRG